MRFLIDRPAFINDTYIEARVQDPKIIELKADVSLDHVSRQWKPLDKEAVAAIAKLGKKKDIVPLMEAVQERQDALTMAEVQHGKKAKHGSAEPGVRVSSLPTGPSERDDVIVTSPAK